MFRIFALIALVLGFVVNAHAGSIIRVADGDCAGLTNAVASASADEETTIILARGGSYLSYGGAYQSCGVFVHRGHVIVEGSGAELQPFCIASVVGVDAGAYLTLRNLLITAPSCGFVPPFLKAISSSGELKLEAVSIEGLYVNNDVGSTMTLRNVTLEGNAIANFGSLDIFNSTLSSYNASIVNNGAGSVVIANSVAQIMASDMCAIAGAHVQSLGGNVVGRNCAWTIASDVKTTSAPNLVLPQDNGGLVPTYALQSSSLARGAGVAAYCEATDARGLARLPGRCDAGAYEFDANSQNVTIGGMNGTFYDHLADGHYVTIQRLHDDTVLVMWNTFDRNGNQAWIYGVGEANDRHIHVEMSQNTGGRLQPGGAATGSGAHAWGTVDIDFASCASATFSYQSSLAAFGSGQFPLDRLASFSDIGCVD